MVVLTVELSTRMLAFARCAMGTPATVYELHFWFASHDFLHVSIRGDFFPKNCDYRVRLY